MVDGTAGRGAHTSAALSDNASKIVARGTKEDDAADWSFNNNRRHPAPMPSRQELTSTA